MKHISQSPSHYQVPASQATGPAQGQTAREAPANPSPDMAKAREDGRYWTRQLHYLSLHSSDGFHLAKHHAQRDPMQRGIGPVLATLAAWENRRHNYAAFAAVRDAAMAQIDTELQEIGLPYEKLFDTPDFARLGK